ncbi:hypothetical protein ASPBRDRAFT_41520 [Aspergillus brasiliensis CBS 101740]|uniref:Uncharacterized protein n=1 Tax=Aspergillus brasiliensis (strain CBS 101740 / IMI 381727 / IBT 21946) TaxID=767769 RepID=A0A1L9UQ62_ASPBC|nr:hypothetical protein ASPBRDRAFT_41520 [Aspergillus brasiliensis CBS 101740]
MGKARGWCFVFFVCDSCLVVVLLIVLVFCSSVASVCLISHTDASGDKLPFLD